MMLMRKLSDHARACGAAWRELADKIAPPCGYCECQLAGSMWQRMRRRSRGVRLQGERYCRPECLEMALAEIFGRTLPVAGRGAIAAHRIPLGLLLLSRQQLTAPQLRIALDTQRAAGGGHGSKKIGAWVQELGFATECEVTAALARQWSCPVLRASSITMDASRFPPIPTLLLESFQMIPVELVQATATLVIAFSEGIDYTVLYAIEQMLGYRTEACLVSPSTMKKSLQTLGQARVSRDIVFDRADDAEECAHIVGNYSVKVGATEIRLAKCREYLWVRLDGQRQPALNLILRLSTEIEPARRVFPDAAAALVV
jgi:hypothetical protein